MDYGNFEYGKILFYNLFIDWSHEVNLIVLEFITTSNGR